METPRQQNEIYSSELKDLEICDTEKLINEILSEVGDEKYIPKIFYAQDFDSFFEKIKEHFEKAGEKVPDKFNSEKCFYSNILKECLIHPKIIQDIEEKGNDLDNFNKLHFFEYVLHESLHGLVDLAWTERYSFKNDLLLDNEDEMSFKARLRLLEEYVVSIVAHQLTVNNTDKVLAGNNIIQGLLNVYIKQNRKSSLTDKQNIQMNSIFSAIGKSEAEIATYFLNQLRSKDGLKNLLEIMQNSNYSTAFSQQHQIQSPEDKIETSSKIKRSSRKVEKTTTPTTGETYILFNRKVKYIGNRVLPNGIKQFQVEYVDDYRVGNHKSNFIKCEKGEKEWYGDWQLEYLVKSK